MSIPRLDASLARGRAMAEARMDSRVTIWRKGPKSAQNEDTGLRGPSWAPVAVGVPFRLGGSDSGDSSSRRQEIAGVELQSATRIGHLPVRFAASLRDSDWLEITSGEHAGRAYSVVEADSKDQATALRVPVLAQTKPKEWTT